MTIIPQINKTACLILLLLFLATMLIISSNLLAFPRPFTLNFLTKVFGLFLLGMVSGIALVYGYRRKFYWLSLLALILLVCAHVYFIALLTLLSAALTDFYLTPNPQPWRQNVHTVLMSGLVCGIITTLFFALGIAAGVHLFRMPDAAWATLFLIFMFPCGFIAGMILGCISLLPQKPWQHWLTRIVIIIIASGFAYFIADQMGIILFAYFLAAALILSFLLSETYHTRLKKRYRQS